MNQLSRFRAITLAGVAIFTQAALGQEDLRKELDAAFKQGIALHRQGKAAEAFPYLNKAAALAPKVFGPDHINTGDILHAVGIAYYNSARFRDAEPLFRGGLKVRQAKLPKDHVKLTESLNYLAGTLRELGQYGEAEDRYKALLAIEEGRRPPRVAELALFLNNLGALYANMARYEDAERALKRALEMREKQAGKDSIEVADVSHNLATVYRGMGLDKEGETLARRGLEIREAKLGPHHVMVATSLNELGTINWKAGRFPQAEKYFLRALEIREKSLGKNHPTTAVLLNNLGLLYIGMGRTGESEGLFRRALAIRETALGPDHPTVASTLANLAALVSELGRRDEAEKMLLRSIKIREAKLGPKHPELASALSNLGNMYMTAGRRAEANALFQRALSINEARFGKNHIEVAACLNNIAILEGQRKGPAAALPLLGRVLKIHEAHYGTDHPSTAAAIANVGNMFWKVGDLAKADEFLERSIRLYETTGGEKSAIAERLKVRADINQAMGKTAFALQLADQAMTIYQATMNDVFAYGSEANMHAYVERNASKLPSLITMAAQSKEDSQAITKALDWTLRTKGAVFDTLCRYRQAQYLLPRDEELGERVARYRAQKEYLANLALNPPAGKINERLQKQIDERRQEVVELEKEINRVIAKKMPQLFSAPEAVTAASVRAKLPADGVLIEFARIPVRNFAKVAWHHPHYFAFVLRPGNAAPRLIDLGPAQEIDADIEALRKEFIDFQEKLRDCESAEEIHALEKKEEKPFKEKSAQLYGRLIRPLAPALGDAKMLYLACDGALNRLPFEALVDGDGKYLIERRRCAYLASGRDLLRTSDKLAKETVVFAGPDYKLEASERVARTEKLLNKKDTQLATRGGSATTLRSAGWKPLPGAAAEADDIKKSLHTSAYGPVKAYVGPDALEEVLKAMPPPRVLHLATHGFFLDRETAPADADEDTEGAGAGWTRGRLKRMENPLLRSGIVLAGANAIGEKDTAVKVEDGWVTAEEIALLNLHGTELVVLSACQTGLGDIKTGEGVYGLRRAFLHAGARALVTSLFEVPDTETRQLMQRFYAGIAAGRGKLISLNSAQVDLIAERRRSHAAAHPFFWASFVLVGNPD